MPKREADKRQTPHNEIDVPEENMSLEQRQHAQQQAHKDDEPIDNRNVDGPNFPAT
ncbi:hypothetical protein [Numidum massiliense]|uniref:hypothetical protein n=1 Tax=Numidum massiliense TaxID=1522315 RepID=UPI0012F9E156|nr:hypothetical protein [Numidum massiliense]